MKSPEVYQIVRQVLGSWCKEQGFKCTKGGMLGWHRPAGDLFIVFWFQVSRDGWDEFAGSKFVVEFQVSERPLVGYYGSRWRLPRFLTDAERERVKLTQNQIIARLRKPPRNHFIFQCDESVVKWYLKKFQSIDEPYPPSSDIWFRYREPEDVAGWAAFVKEVLPRIINQLSVTAGNSSSDKLVSLQ